MFSQNESRISQMTYCEGGNLCDSSIAEVNMGSTTKPSIIDDFSILAFINHSSLASGHQLVQKTVKYKRHLSIFL